MLNQGLSRKATDHPVQATHGGLSLAKGVLPILILGVNFPLKLGSSLATRNSPAHSFPRAFSPKVRQETSLSQLDPPGHLPTSRYLPRCQNRVEQPPPFQHKEESAGDRGQHWMKSPQVL